MTPITSAAGDETTLVTPLAFFDLDGTLVVGNTQQFLVRFLHRRGAIGWPFLLGTALWFAGYRLGVVKPTDRARTRAARLLAGRSTAEIDELMDAFTGEMLVPRLHAGAVAALRAQQAGGGRVVILSAALDPLVRGLARGLGVGDSVGTALEVRDGHYTGSVVGRAIYGDEKVRAARRVIDAAGLDAADCGAYADHETDIALLESVGHPVAVNPRPALLQVARERGWPVIL
jgi:HAD superfamily hydrolase (TIGR01490 family)